MKKIFLLITAFCLYTGFAEKACGQSVYDVNGDNTVNIIDITDVTGNVNSRNSKYDLNGDGVIDNKDAAIVVDSILGRNDSHVITSMLVIHMKDSTWSTVILSERPVITFNDSTMVIKTSAKSMSLPLRNITVARFQEKIQVTKAEALTFIRKNGKIKNIFVV